MGSRSIRNTSAEGRNNGLRVESRELRVEEGALTLLTLNSKLSTLSE